MTTTATELHGAPLAIAGARARARALLRRVLDKPTDAAGLAAFRILFGALMTGAVIRFLARGWVRELYLDPPFHFTYLGFEWVRPWPAWGMYLHFAVMGLAALLLMLGAFTRLAALAFFLLFTYAELIDKTAYLNHYYFVSLVSLLLVFLPAGAAWSVDALRRGVGAPRLRAWAYSLLRAQVAIVYLYAGFAKLNGDWLLRGEPLRTWLRARTDVPLIGLALGEPATAYLMSWGGAAFDLGIVGLLAWRRTRPWAFAAAVVFHTAVWLLFPIGVFSWVMLVAITIFFDPGWPRRLLRPFSAEGGASRETPGGAPPPLPSWHAALLGGYVALQALLPLRFLLYPGAVNWTEEGFRFAWRVMLVEKSGQVEFEVLTATPERRFYIFPRQELTPLQYKMMSTQPDMIHEYALHLAERYRREGYLGVRVHAHAWAALNRRPSQRLIDPAVDLAAQDRGFAPQRWILPLGAGLEPGSRREPTSHAP